MLASNRWPADIYRANHEAVIRWSCQTAGAGFDDTDLGIDPAALRAGQERRVVSSILRFADALNGSLVQRDAMDASLLKGRGNGVLR